MGLDISLDDDRSFFPSTQTYARPKVSEPHYFLFNATGSEYFRIWIVNLLLSVLTLGIYSAWAKVRRLQYFYRNTQLAGYRFDFDGSPMAILRGRIVALIVLSGYWRLGMLSKPLATLVFAILVFVGPWLYHNALRFRCARSSYAGMPFHFVGALPQAYWIVGPIIAIFLLPTLLLVYTDLYSEVRAGRGGTMGLLSLIPVLAWPYWQWRLRRYTTNATALGNHSFSFKAKSGQYYNIYAKAGLLELGLLVVFGVLAGFMAGFFGAAFKNIGRGNWLGHNLSLLFIAVGAVALFVLLVLMLAIFWPYFTARMQNMVWNNTSLDGFGFTSEVRARSLMNIQIGNMLLTLVTLGFYHPFAVVRMQKYRIESLAWTGDIHALRADADAGQAGAAGLEAADFLGFDIGL